MTAIDYVVRDGAGAIERGVVPAVSLATSIPVSSGQEVSLNLRQADVRGYARDGGNLVIELADGRLVTLEGYFNDSGVANRLFISAEGYLNEVAFVETADGGLFGQYGPTEQWGKWSPSDDLIFLGGTDVAAIGADDDEVSMFAAGLLGVPGLLGAGAAAAGVGAVALASGGGGDGAVADPVVAADPVATPVQQAIAPFVNNADDNTTIGGDSVTPHQAVVTGGGEPGDTVAVTVGNQVINTAIGDDGTFEAIFTGGTFPNDGTHEAVVVVTDMSGAGTTLDGPGFLIDTTPPEVIITSGTQSTGDLFNAAAFASGVTVTGTSEPGATIDMTISGVTQSTTVANDGSFSLTWPAGSLQDGEYNADISIVARDTIGNSGTSSDVLVVDTVSEVSIATATIETDGIINAVEHSDGVTVNGTAQPGSSVVVSFGAVSTTVVANASGGWAADFASSDIPTGEYDATLTAVATDTVGNTATASGTVRVDTVANAIAVTHPIEGDDIINGVEAAQGVVLAGTSVPGAVVSVTLQGVTHSATASASGDWQVPFAAGEVQSGTYTALISATSTDAAGNVNTISDSVLVDTQVDNFAINAGGVEGDNIINSVEQSDGVLVSGTVEPGSSVLVTLAGVTVPAVVDGSGNWTASFSAAQVPTGELDTNVSVTATDVAGNMANIVEGVRIDTFVNALSFDANSSAGSVEGDGTINAIEALDGVNLGGQVEPGSTVIVNFNGTNHTAAVDASGNWTVVIPAASIAQGSYDASITVNATDSVGNTDSISQTVRVDTDAPDGPVIAAFTRDTEGFRAISTEGNNDAIDVDQVAADGTTSDAPATDTFIQGFDETLHAFDTRVPDGSDLVVSNTDDAGNVTSTYLALDDENPGSTVSLAAQNLTGFQIDAVDLQFAEAGTLALTEADVLALSQTTDALTVHGGSDDTVQIAGATATGSTTINGQLYTTYQAGDATLIIDSEITVEEPPVI